MTHNEIKDFYGYPRTLLLRNNNTLADTIVSTRVLFLTSEQGILSRAAALSPRLAALPLAVPESFFGLERRKL